VGEWRERERERGEERGEEEKAYALIACTIPFWQWLPFTWLQ